MINLKYLNNSLRPIEESSKKWEISQSLRSFERTLGHKDKKADSHCCILHVIPSAVRDLTLSQSIPE